MPADMNDAFDRIEKLLEFPADFPIKIIGQRHDDFAQVIAELVHQHVPQFDPATLIIKPSSQGRFLSLTVSVRVDSREQLQALYQALADHEMVRIVL